MTNMINETIQDFAETLLNRIMYDLGWEHHIFFSLEEGEASKAVLVEENHDIYERPLVRHVRGQEIPYKVSQALVAYELLEERLVGWTSRGRDDVRKNIIQKEYSVYHSLKGLLTIQDNACKEVDWGTNEESCTMCGISEEDTHDLESSVKEGAIAKLSLIILESLANVYPWVTTAKFAYTEEGELNSCILWRDGVRYEALRPSPSEEYLIAMLFYDVVQRIVGEDIKSCTKATTAYNEITRLLGPLVKGTNKPDNVFENQLRDARQLADILLYDLGNYPYVQMFRNDAKKAVTAIINQGSKKFVGVAKTHVLDVYTPDVGKAVALYKAFQEVLEHDSLQGVTKFTQEALQYLRKADELYKNITTL